MFSHTRTHITQYEEYEDEEVELDNGQITPTFTKALDEKDPEVIRELIELIRKVGGLDRLEEQLRLRLSLTENSSIVSAKSTNGRGRPSSSPIMQTLYDQIFNNPNATASGRQLVRTTINNQDSTNSELRPSVQRQNKENKYSSVIRNGPQNEGVDQLDESDVVIKDRPQYVVLTRTNQKTKTQNVDDDQEEEEDDDDDTVGHGGDVANRLSDTKQTTQSLYVNIRRQRPSTTEPSAAEDNDDVNLGSSEAPNRNHYISINRSRPTRPTQERAEKAEVSTTTDNK